eukprot:GHVL01006608.1.p1 GENE.GHVL01006608.1~~GHVL01006608.1.p1  ORF type:complete len:434 (-),score=67.54 GHVL01006608.1:108-1409(-)
MLVWLRTLCGCPEFDAVPDMTQLAELEFWEILNSFNMKSVEEIKNFEKTTNHDVKAVEYYIRNRLTQNENLKCFSEFIHFGCTSEDVNNVSYALMVKGALMNFIQPEMAKIVSITANLANEFHDSCMMARTHGQPATPTTFGKEMANFASRLATQLDKINNTKFFVKFNGAVGNYNAASFAEPEVDWENLSKKMIETNFFLTFQPYSAQCESHDWLCELCDNVARFNRILLDFNQDMWTYISQDLIKLKKMDKEVGSSTMPHKVNPIDFENSEGNIGVANALLEFLSRKLPISRLQRDLSDSTVQRNIGVALSHCYISYISFLKGLSKIQPNIEKMKEVLDIEGWALLAEPIQTVLRKSGVPGAYEAVKDFTRGETVGEESIRRFIGSIKMKISENDYNRLMELRPSTYLGIASKLSKSINVDKIVKFSFPRN